MLLEKKIRFRNGHTEIINAGSSPEKSNWCSWRNEIFTLTHTHNEGKYKMLSGRKVHLNLNQASNAALVLASSIDFHILVPTELNVMKCELYSDAIANLSIKAYNVIWERQSNTVIWSKITIDACVCRKNNKSRIGSMWWIIFKLNFVKQDTSSFQTFGLLTWYKTNIT